MSTIIKSFFSTNTTQTFTVPPFVEHIMIKAWGAGGGYSPGNSNGGPGGFSTGTLPVSTNQTLNIMVGQGGRGNFSINQMYGGGGSGGNDSSNLNIDGSAGGGRSGVSIDQGYQLIIAGGGGGAGGGINNNVWSNGGAGGGVNGINGWVNASGNPNAPGLGATQFIGGTGGKSTSTPNGDGFDGVASQGGSGGNTATFNTGGGGGGGGGYFGGGGGAAQFTDTNNPLEQDCAGGGGSGYIDSTVVIGGNTYSTPQNTNTSSGGSLVEPPNNTDPNYRRGTGVGGHGGVIPVDGGGGLVVLIYNQPDLIMNKAVNKNYADANDTLTYTITINNSGSVTVNNIVFVDTVPANTAFIPNSFTLDGTPMPVTSNPLGITIPSIGINAVSTIQFNVIVSPTIPSPNIVTNISTSSYSGGFIFNSNPVTTTINYATLKSTKYTDKYYAVVGDTISYSIALYNIGSVSADNVVFLDTVPSGSTFVPNSLKQDGISLIGTPDSPGVTLPSSIGPGLTSTVTFQVNVITIPSPNTILNSANQIYTYIINPTTTPIITGSRASNTNIISTTISMAVIAMSKSVSKTYATCGDVLTYTLTLNNAGNTTATNVFFVDTIPNGLALVPNSVNINGNTIPGANPSLGITIPNIPAYETSTLSFNAIVSC